MSTARERSIETHVAHPWLRQIDVAYVRGVEDPLLDEVAANLLARFQEMGHIAREIPTNDTDVIFTTALLGEEVPWREAAIFNVRKNFDLVHTPTIYTLIHATPERFEGMLEELNRALAKDPIDNADFEYPGLAPTAHRVLVEQGQRGGAILALARLAQAQSKSIKILLVVGEEKPDEVYHFDLVGAHPRTPADDTEFFYTDIVLRIVTSESTTEVTNHGVVDVPIPREAWEKLSTPSAMKLAARELDARNFFTEMVRIADLVYVPAVADAVSSQYSEGCFATWDPELGALIATVTGSARPVDKGNITDDDLAVIVGLQPDGSGALVREVDGKRNDPPSSEAVEMMGMDNALDCVTLGEAWGIPGEVPVVRSKLHGHRGVAEFDPGLVEHVHLDDLYYHFLVSCSTEAQANAIKIAFQRSQTLRDPDDPRNLAFTVLPGHGVMIVEKWIPGKKPFEAMWEAFDTKAIVIENRIPQGPFDYVETAEGRMMLEVL